MLSLVRALSTSFSASLRLCLSSMARRRGSPAWTSQVRVPDLQVAHAPRTHASPSGSPPSPRRTTSRRSLVGEPVVPAGDHEARREALHVPLPRPGQRLVEVVDVEHELALGRAEHAEVGEVGVAARLDLIPDRGVDGQVRGHDGGRAAVEGERRRDHPAVPDGDEFGDPARGLLLQDVDRVRPVGRGLPGRVAGPRDRGPRRLPARRAFLGAARGARPAGPQPSLAICLSDLGLFLRVCDRRVAHKGLPHLDGKRLPYGKPPVNGGAARRWGPRASNCHAAIFDRESGWQPIRVDTRRLVS